MNFVKHIITAIYVVVNGGVLRLKKSIILIVLSIVLISCSSEPIQKNNSMHKSMTSREALENGYVVAGPSGLANVDTLEQFYEDVQNKVRNRITLAHYTDEGDPIYIDLEFDGEKVLYVRDDTWDEFGGQDKGVSETTCTLLEKRDGLYGNLNGTEYYLTSCKEDVGYSDPEKKEYYLLFVSDKEGLH